MPRDGYIEFQERSRAKGYLITFRCYGTWLHGDERGSVDRRYYNRFGGAKIAPSEETKRRKLGQLKQAPFVLNRSERVVVERAIREVCEHRKYAMFAVNVRTNHIHLVVSNSDSPERMMNTFKTYSTRALRKAGLVDEKYRPWSRHGSTRYLWTDAHVAAAIEYVATGQGEDLPIFD